MKFKKGILLIALTFFIVLLSADLSAQCAMCKSNLEMARNGGGTNVGNTLNMGILYLLALPYLVAAVFGFIYYRNHKLKKAKASN
ncbi:MAG: hypothetical protein ACOVP1_02875 [Bacteroidia bacterium]